MKPHERKAVTEAILRKKGIPFLPSLPCIESEEDADLRTPEEIGVRMFCLFCVIGSAYDLSDTSYRQYLKKNRLWHHLTHDELSFLSSPAPDRQYCKTLTWRTEALFVLMWAVRLFRSLPLPTNQIDNQRIIAKFPSLEKSPWPFIRGLKLRPISEILNASDLLYRLHWATTQAKLDGQAAPAGLDPEIVCEWHYAINWITKYDDADWDDVVTDT